MAARWRKTPRPGGLMNILFRQGFQLTENGKVLLSVNAAHEMGKATPTGWYWAGLGQNSCQQLCTTKEEAKAQADAWYKQHLKDKK